jgi:hypothetical protein
MLLLLLPLAARSATTLTKLPPTNKRQCVTDRLQLQAALLYNKTRGHLKEDDCTNAWQLDTSFLNVLGFHCKMNPMPGATPVPTWMTNDHTALLCFETNPCWLPARGELAQMIQTLSPCVPGLQMTLTLSQVSSGLDCALLPQCIWCSSHKTIEQDRYALRHCASACLNEQR